MRLGPVAILLTAVVGLGALSIDMFLPSLPALAAFYRTDAATAQEVFSNSRLPARRSVAALFHQFVWKSARRRSDTPINPTTAGDSRRGLKIVA